MKRDDKKLELWISKEELLIISSALIEFYQESCWDINVSKDQDIFKKEFLLKFGFSLDELGCIKGGFCDLRRNFRSIDIEGIYIYLSKNKLKKAKVIYTALNECSKNYEDYEISIRVGRSKQELDRVLNEFKEKVMDASL